ncbi:hypothetical protein MMC17_010249 [Xylographa soralifera]|nr:hypothetical protein [Xylographa soralifera]
MEPNTSSVSQLKKRKRGLDIKNLEKVLNTEPDDYELAPSTLSLPEARQIFNLRKVQDVLWAGIEELPIPQYLSDTIDRILAVTSETFQTNEAFSRTIIDQILISAIYEENHTQASHQRDQSQPEDPAILDLKHETQIQRQVTYKGETRMLSGYADYTVWYDSQTRSNLATNLIIIEAKKICSTDTCMGQLTAYMGAVHAYRKDEQKQNSVVYGAASDGLSFRFCRIDNEGNWSDSLLMEWEKGHKSTIYSIFRSLIRIAALSSPTTSLIKNIQQREEVLASFGSPERISRFDYALSALKVLEEDDETEIISLRERSS